MKKIILTASFALALIALNAQDFKTMAPEDSAKHFFELGKKALDNKDMVAASEAFAKLAEIENGVFEVKNKETREKEYYFSKEALDKAVAKGNYSKSKAKAVSTGYGDKVTGLINTVIDQTSKEASQAYNQKEYNTAAEKFIQTYDLQKTSGRANQDYMYYAAVAYQLDKQLDKAAPIYENLIKSGYDGVRTTYFATNVAGDQKNNFLDKETWEAFQKDPIKSKLYKDWGSETSKDITKDLYTYAASVNYDLKNFKRASQIAEKGLKKYKGDETLQTILTNSMYGSGDSEAYITQLRKNVQENPKDTHSLYNLGVMLSGEKASEVNLNEAKEVFKKVLQLDPNNTNASLNLAALIIKDDANVVNQLNNIKGTSASENARYEELLNQRKSIHKRALPYLEQVAKAKPDDIAVLKNLSISYGVLGIDAEKAKVKQQIKALEK
ncbi:MAG: tetratricopeptide repeat protein [Flavobacteriales bacterium]